MILVGVVMFMLALTILGLSLFALSSYEAQFFTASVSREQSLQNAESGMELAMALLAQSPPPQRLEDVQRVAGQFGITSMLAYQQRSDTYMLHDTTSQGPLNWAKPVTLVVSARSGGVERTFEAQYLPTPAENPYQKLLVSGTGIRVNSSATDVLELSGGVWHPVLSSSDTSWTSRVTWSDGRPVKTDTPPLPRANEFLAAHFTDLATEVPSDTVFTPGSPYRMGLRNPGPGPKFFRCPSPGAGVGHAEFSEYAFYCDNEIQLYIRGIVVWVIPDGVCFAERVRVIPEDGVPSTLVIVASRNGRDEGFENRAIAFRGGLTITNPAAHVYLVSEDEISLTHRPPFEETSQDARRLSVVAGGRITLAGPESGDRFRLAYDALDMDALTEQLMAGGALPSLSVNASSMFSMSRPSWNETTPR